MRTTFRALCLVVGIATLCSAAYAQFAQRGSVNGFVTDSSGAFVQGAKITLKDLDRNQVLTGQTNSAGRYEFSQLNFGKYQVVVEQSGFKKAESQVLESLRRHAFTGLGKRKRRGHDRAAAGGYRKRLL